MALPTYKNINLGIDLSNASQLWHDVKNHDTWDTNTVWWTDDKTPSRSNPNDDTQNWFSMLGYTEAGQPVFPYFVENPIVVALYEKFKHCCGYWGADIDYFYSNLAIRQCSGRNNLPAQKNPSNIGTFWLAIPVEITPGYENIYIYDAGTADANLIETITTSVGQPYFFRFRECHFNWQQQSEEKDLSKVRKEILLWFTDECGDMDAVMNTFDPATLSD